MPTQWGLQDRITANDLGKVKFLFNFTNEEDLMSVLQKGPFHYNYCMFVLIKYDMLFKHCTTCGLMSHEKDYCPTMEATSRGQLERGGIRLPAEQGGARAQAERGGVFARVQLPQDHNGHQPFLRYREPDSRRQHEQDGTNVVASRWADTRHINARRGRYHADDDYQSRNRGAVSHSDRIMRRRDEMPRSARYGENRYGRGPYDRNAEQSWHEKKVEKARVTGKSTTNVDVQGGSSKAHEVVPY
ncbi:unnamed protein product, partial [Brassica oleracea]